MREDVRKAISVIGAKPLAGQNKLCENLPVDVLGDDRAVAITSATMRKVSAVEGGFVEGVRSAMPLLLVLTETCIHVVRDKSKFGRGKTEYSTIMLHRVRDHARANTDRRFGRSFAKDRLLAFDHMHGAELVTEVYDLPSDEEVVRSLVEL